MKKSLSLILALLLLCSLCACGASSAKYEAAPAEAPMEYMPEPAAAEESFEYQSDSVYGGFAADNSALLADAGGASEPNVSEEKIIYSASATLETVDFDTAVAALGELVKSYGGYVQSSTVNGTNYFASARGYTSNRSADYTIRVPSGSFSQLMSDLPTLGNVPYSYTYQENISSQYYDVAAHVAALEVQEQTLLSLMEKAESIDDVIAVESRLSEVRYQIESLQSTLRGWDRQVSYSTVTVSVYEVEEYTPQETVSVSYGEKLAKALRRGFASFGRFFSDLVLDIVGALPALVLIAVVAVFGVRALVKRIRRKKAVNTAPVEKKEEK